MRLGCLLARSPDPTNTQNYLDIARELEAEGFDSLWIPQMIGRGMLALDPFVALSAAAATKKLELGTAILQLPLYRPADLILRILSLRLIVGDRLSLGVGAGSTQADFDAMEMNYATRFKVFNQLLDQLKEGIKTGKFGDLDFNPPPAALGDQKMIYGTWGKGVARAAANFDGWVASALNRTDDEVLDALKNYRASNGKRAIVSSVIVMPGADLGEVKERLTKFKEAGFDDAVLAPFALNPSLAELRKLVD